MNVREKLVEVLNGIIDGGFKWHSYSYESGEQLNNDEIASHLIAHGVTVQEWKPISEPPEEKGTYLVCTDNGGVLLGHWYGTAWNAGGGAKKHLAYWMEKPQPPKGE